MATTTTKKLAKALADREARAASIATQIAAATERQASLRAQIGEAVASGADATAFQADLRAVGDELDGYERVRTPLGHEMARRKAEPWPRADARS